MPGAIPADPDLRGLHVQPEENKAWVPSHRPLPARAPLIGRQRPNYLANHRQLTYQEIAERLNREKARARMAQGVYHFKEDEYILEKLDPRHRPGGSLVFIWDFYMEYQCYKQSITLNAGAVQPGHGQRAFPASEHFFPWIDRISAEGWVWTCTLMQYAYTLFWDRYVKNGPNWRPGPRQWDQLKWALDHWPGAYGEGVKFLTGVQALPHRVWKTAEGRLGWNFNVLTGEGDLLDTGQTATAFGTGYIWTLNEDNHFYTTPQEYGRLHHSSLTAGQGVLAAGEWVVSQGVLRLITAQTGHYKVPMPSLVRAIQRINTRLGVSPDTYHVRLFTTGNPVRPVEIRANEFLFNYRRNPRGMEQTYRVFSR